MGEGDFCLNKVNIIIIFIIDDRAFSPFRYHQTLFFSRFRSCAARAQLDGKRYSHQLNN
jgi:hypothetical protein